MSPQPKPIYHLEDNRLAMACCYRHLCSLDLRRGHFARMHVRHSRGERLGRNVVASNNNGGSSNKEQKMSFGDRLLDYIEGGPKLRKWYGAPDQLPRDARAGDVGREPDEEQQLEEDEARDCILVTDGDSMTGQLVLLSLIVKRVRVRALVKDLKEFAAAFGSYIEPVVGDVEDKKTLKRALRGVYAIVCPTKVGALSDKEVVAGLQHIVFLSQFSGSSAVGGLAGLFNSNARRQAEQDETAVRNLGIPCTIIRCASLCDEPGGQKGLMFDEGSAGKGTLSREDAAMVCAKALEFPPKQFLILEVANGGSPVKDWNTVFSAVNARST